MMTLADLRNLPATVDLQTAAKVLGLGRTKAYELAQRGTFPVRLLRIGQTYRVSSAELLALLGIVDAGSGAA